MESFRKLGLSDVTVKAIEAKGYTEPTEIQAKAIPLLLEGEKDIVAQSQTGTGKTAGFALPIIERLSGGKGTKALILAPTRELALQVTKEFDSLKGKKNLKTLTVYGGASMRDQIQKLRDGVDIVVGTPGRVMDLIKRGKLIITGIEYCVLDEADEMLNMGFVDDIETILKKTPKDKMMMLFSATIPMQIKKIAERFMREYITINTKKQELVTDLVEQIYYEIHSGDRFEGIRRIIGITKDFHGIVFCKTKIEVDRLCANLINANYSAGALHGDIAQSTREKILGQFKERKIIVLIATDVAARGIDVNDLTHVINYSLPQSPELYVHRIGRTGRAGKKGIAITFLIPSERNKLRFVERLTGCKITKMELPKVKDVIKAKQVNLEKEIEEIMSSKKSGKFDELATKLLLKGDATKVVSAVLEHSFGGKDASHKELKKVTLSDHASSSGASRRFGGRGRNNSGDRSRGRRGSSPRRDGRRDGSRRDSPRRGSNDSEDRSQGRRNNYKRSSNDSGSRNNERKNESGERKSSNKKRRGNDSGFYKDRGKRRRE